jgi:hypothetical protein
MILRKILLLPPNSNHHRYVTSTMIDNNCFQDNYFFPMFNYELPTPCNKTIFSLIMHVIQQTKHCKETNLVSFIPNWVSKSTHNCHKYSPPNTFQRELAKFIHSFGRYVHGQYTLFITCIYYHPYTSTYSHLKCNYLLKRFSNDHKHCATKGFIVNSAINPSPYLLRLGCYVNCRYLILEMFLRYPHT